MTAAMKAPFPWFGGKSRAAPLLWERFGDVPNYVEPFAGSLAVLLGRPHAPKTETVNDLDCFLANFWRAAAHAPDEVAAWAHSPVNEADLHARHLWLVNRADFRERMKTDPDHFDAKIAGWWVWGQCSWIGSGWCRNAGRGVHRKLPHVGDAGMGVHRQLPHVGNAGRGVHRKLPHVGDAGRGEAVAVYFAELSARLQRVRVCCGEWDRVLTPSVTTRHGLTAVLLDPPYLTEGRTKNLYTHDDGEVAHKVQAWAVEHGADPLLRIAYCGYASDSQEFPADWECVPWKATGGYNSDQGDQANCRRERIWFSPSCLRQGEGFALTPGAKRPGKRCRV